MKETLEQEYKRLKKEVAEMNEDLNERQKEVSNSNPPTADFSVIPALIDLKIKRMEEIEEQLKAKRVSTS